MIAGSGFSISILAAKRWIKKEPSLFELFLGVYMIPTTSKPTNVDGSKTSSGSGADTYCDEVNLENDIIIIVRCLFLLVNQSRRL